MVRAVSFYETLQLTPKHKGGFSNLTLINKTDIFIDIELREIR